MRIVINDANILIDLIQLELIETFFQIEHLDLQTTDFVFEELFEEQKEKIKPLISNRLLKIIESDENDLLQISMLMNTTIGLSFEDCSVLYYAKNLQGILFTGDGRLRKQTLASGIEVKGILYIFDQLLFSSLISFEIAIEKINQLYLINNRLPIKAKEERITHWQRFEHYHQK